jgi:DHA1 family tetracycline resistance protein-like MFS transporter
MNQRLQLMNHSKERRLKHYLLVLFIENISLALVYPAVPEAIFAISKTRSDAIAYSTIDLFIFPLAYIFGSVYAAWKLDKDGRRSLLLSSIGINALGLSLMLQPIFNIQILIARTLSGAGQAYTSVLQANVSDITSPESRPRYFGLINATIACSFITGLLLAGLLTWKFDNFRILFKLSFVSSLIGLTYAFVFCPETYRPAISQLEQSRETSKISFTSAFGSRFNEAKLFFNGSNKAGFWMLFCCNLSNFGIFAFWTLYSKSRFDWTVTQISGSLLLMAVTAAVSQSLVLPFCLKNIGERKLFSVAIGSSIGYLVLLAFCTNGFIFALLPLLNVIGFTSTSLLQGKLSEQTPPDSQGLLTSTFGLLTGAGTMLSVVLSGCLTWLISLQPSYGRSLEGLPFLVLAILLGVGWFSAGRSIQFER